MSTEISEVFSKMRKEKNISQRKAAQDLGVSQALLSHYENGVREPRLEFIVRACDYYGISADYLFGRTDAPKNPMIMGTVNKNAGNEKPSPSLWKNAGMQDIVGSLSALLTMVYERYGEEALTSLAKYFSVSVYKFSRIMSRAAEKEDLVEYKIPDHSVTLLSDTAMKLLEMAFVEQTTSREAETGSYFEDNIKENCNDIFGMLTDWSGSIEEEISEMLVRK